MSVTSNNFLNQAQHGCVGKMGKIFQCNDMLLLHGFLKSDKIIMHTQEVLSIKDLPHKDSTHRGLAGTGATGAAAPAKF